MPVQLMIAISNTHAPLQLCIVTPQNYNSCDHYQCHCNCNVIWSDNTELQWCMGVANNYTCYRQLYRLVSLLFTPVQLCNF